MGDVVEFVGGPQDGLCLDLDVFEDSEHKPTTVMCDLVHDDTSIRTYTYRLVGFEVQKNCTRWSYHIVF